MKILIIGAGAIGCLIGGKLAQNGQSVTLVGRAQFVEAVQQHGLRLHISKTIHRIDNVQAVAALAEAFQQAAGEGKPYDLAVLTVKSYDTVATLQELSTALDDYTQSTPTIVSLQNGVSNEEAISACLGAEHVIAGTITAPVEIPEPGLIHVTKPKFVVGLAPWKPSAENTDLEYFRAALASAGIVVAIYTDARSMKWTKLLMNMIGNATSAILAEPPHRTFTDARIADLEIDALREALAVMAKANIAPVNVEKYPLGTLAPLLRYGPKALLRPMLRWIVSGARGGKMPSLYLDLEKGKAETEVNWLNGAVVRTGEAVHVPTPVNRMLNEVVQRLAHHPSQWPAWQRQPAKLVAEVEFLRQQSKT
jgi:2-dehydropantoate 2-reductase